MKKYRVAVLISGNGSNLQALINAARESDYPAEIVLVISNKKDAYGLVRAKEAGIDSYVIEHKAYNSREDFDKALDERLDEYSIEIVCLAGFMRILSSEFVEKWQGRMLNIHPSLLPDFKGAHAVRDALLAGVSESGCSVHMVTSELDGGEVIAQRKVPVLPEDNEESLHSRIHEQEYIIYPEAIKSLIRKL
ncbi:MAG: phosphoribosylglycinamide formyltransferase [Rickettsiales bacterium]